jgi:hypothetical protein
MPMTELLFKHLANMLGDNNWGTLGNLALRFSAGRRSVIWDCYETVATSA